MRPQRGDPTQDRRGVEAELGHQRHFEALPARQSHFGPQRFVEGARGDPRMALRIAGEGDRAQTVALDQAGGQEVMAVGKGAHRVIGVAADDQGGTYFCFARGPLQEVARLGKAREATDSDVRHGLETAASQPGAGGDDVVMRDTSRMVDKHRPSLREMT